MKQLTVKDLIEELSKFKQDLPIIFAMESIDLGLPTMKEISTKEWTPKGEVDEKYLEILFYE